MSDLTEDLRSIAKGLHTGSWADVCNEAAAEIERLRGEIAELTEWKETAIAVRKHIERLSQCEPSTSLVGGTRTDAMKKST